MILLRTLGYLLWFVGMYLETPVIFLSCVAGFTYLFHLGLQWLLS